MSLMLCDQEAKEVVSKRIRDIISDHAGSAKTIPSNSKMYQEEMHEIVVWGELLAILNGGE